MPQVGLEYVDKQLKHGQIGLFGQIGLGPPYVIPLNLYIQSALIYFLLSTYWAR